MVAAVVGAVEPLQLEEQEPQTKDIVVAQRQLLRNMAVAVAVVLMQ